MLFPNKGKNALKLADTEKVQEALNKIQEKCTARVFWAEELQDMVKYEIRRGSICSLPKSYMEGLTFILYSGTVPRSSRGYRTAVTKVIVTYRKGAWYITSLGRITVDYVRKAVVTVTNSKQLSKILEAYMDANGIVREYNNTDETVLTAPLENLPAYLAEKGTDSKIALARMEHGWDISER